MDHREHGGVHDQGTPAAAELEQSVLAAEAQRREALLAGDIAALRRLVLPQALFVHASGHLVTGKDWLSDLEEGRFSYDGMSVTDVRVAATGTTGVVSFAQESAIRFGGELHHSSTRSTSVWTTGERVQMIAFQTTHVEAPALEE